MIRPVLDLFLAFCAAACGAAVFALIGFPAAALTGAATGVTLAGLAALRFEMPVWLRNGAFVLLGINIGNGVTPESLQAAAAWPVSIALLALSLPLGMVIAQAGMVRWMGFARRDAVLASAPGHLSFVLSLSMEQGASTARIAVIQSIRVPLLVSVFFEPPTDTGDAAREMSLLSLAGLFGGALALGWVYLRLRVPAPLLMAGTTLSALGHAVDLTPGQLSPGLGAAVFMVLGVLIGSRFSGQSGAVLRGAVLAGVWLTAVNVAVTLLAVGAALALLDVLAPVLMVAYAPGGVEAMAAIAITLGLNPAFVAAHRVVRLLVLSVLVPVWVHKLRGAKPEGSF